MMLVPLLRILVAGMLATPLAATSADGAVAAVQTTACAMPVKPSGPARLPAPKDREVNVVVNCPALLPLDSPAQIVSLPHGTSPPGGRPGTSPLAPELPLKCANKLELRLTKDISFGVTTGSEGLSWASLALMGVLAAGALVATALSLKQRGKSSTNASVSQSSPSTVVAVLFAVGFAVTLGYAIGKRESTPPPAVVVSDDQLARAIPAAKVVEQFAAAAASEQDHLRNRIAALDKDLAVCRARAEPALPVASTTGSWLLLLVGFLAGSMGTVFVGWFRDGAGLGKVGGDASLVPTLRAAKTLLAQVPQQTEAVPKALLESVDKLLASALGKKE